MHAADIYAVNVFICVIVLHILNVAAQCGRLHDAADTKPIGLHQGG